MLKLPIVRLNFPEGRKEFFFFNIPFTDKNFDFGARKSRQNEINQNILASISNTGTLAKPLDDAPSGIDFIFVLNVRESEVYPPLFLPEDLACVEDKMSGYKSKLKF